MQGEFQDYKIKEQIIKINFKGRTLREQFPNAYEVNELCDYLERCSKHSVDFFETLVKTNNLEAIFQMASVGISMHYKLGNLVRGYNGPEFNRSGKDFLDIAEQLKKYQEKKD